MDNKRLTLPLQQRYEYAYNLAYQVACEQLGKIADIEEQCRKSDTQLRIVDSRTEIVIQHLARPYLVTLPDVKVSLADSDEVIPIRDKLLVLHYFISAKGTPVANKLITFRDLPEGTVYSPTFTQRTIKPLVDNFGKDPHLLIDTAAKLGGHKADFGDTAVVIDAFSRIAITIILWRGDDELAPQGNVVFDATISDYLPTEDITVLCETIAWKLVRSLRGT